MPETIKQELIRRLELKDASDSDLDELLPRRRDSLSEPQRDHLFDRMALTILREDEQDDPFKSPRRLTPHITLTEPEGETLP